MSYRITTVTVNDGQDMGRNNIVAFWTDPSWRLGWTIPLDRLVRCNEMRGSGSLLRDRDTKRHLKAVDEDGKLVGYVRFKLPDGDEWRNAWPEAKTPEVPEEERKQLEGLYARGSKEWEAGVRDLPLVDEPVSGMSRKLHDERKGHMEIELLAVHPDHRNRGTGTRLVKRGIEMADQLGLDMYVVAFEGGYPVYKGSGFEILEHLELDNSVYGGAGVLHRYFMERKTAGKSQAGRNVGQDASG
ncbi:acyl-CoA N-acyltransferase [Immersiella caudata]|uniref:Acyl-CoA N-acyltransferase n=1 Tax=Immersiella caudata TaxID=314043 RepID=A0AA40C0G3_9PEZI|nr:acyl-CoA N-acyltransferase [Immersiella caudata]